MAGIAVPQGAFVDDEEAAAAAAEAEAGAPLKMFRFARRRADFERVEEDVDSYCVAAPKLDAFLCEHGRFRLNVHENRLRRCMNTKLVERIAEKLAERQGQHTRKGPRRLGNRYREMILGDDGGPDGLLFVLFDYGAFSKTNHKDEYIMAAPPKGAGGVRRYVVEAIVKPALRAAYDLNERETMPAFIGRWSVPPQHAQARPRGGRRGGRRTAAQRERDRTVRSTLYIPRRLWSVFARQVDRRVEEEVALGHLKEHQLLFYICQHGLKEPDRAIVDRILRRTRENAEFLAYQIHHGVTLVARKRSAIMCRFRYLAGVLHTTVSGGSSRYQKYVPFDLEGIGHFNVSSTFKDYVLEEIRTALGGMQDIGIIIYIQVYNPDIHDIKSFKWLVDIATLVLMGGPMVRFPRDDEAYDEEEEEEDGDGDGSYGSDGGSHDEDEEYVQEGRWEDRYANVWQEEEALQRHGVGDEDEVGGSAAGADAAAAARQQVDADAAAEAAVDELPLFCSSYHYRLERKALHAWKTYLGRYRDGRGVNMRIEYVVDYRNGTHLRECMDGGGGQRRSREEQQGEAAAAEAAEPMEVVSTTMGEVILRNMLRRDVIVVTGNDGCGGGGGDDLWQRHLMESSAELWDLIHGGFAGAHLAGDTAWPVSRHDMQVLHNLHTKLNYYCYGSGNCLNYKTLQQMWGGRFAEAARERLRGVRNRRVPLSAPEHTDVRRGCRLQDTHLYDTVPDCIGQRDTFAGNRQLKSYVFLLCGAYVATGTMVLELEVLPITSMAGQFLAETLFLLRCYANYARAYQMLPSDHRRGRGKRSADEIAGMLPRMSDVQDEDLFSLRALHMWHVEQEQEDAVQEEEEDAERNKRQRNQGAGEQAAGAAAGAAGGGGNVFRVARGQVVSAGRVAAAMVAPRFVFGSIVLRSVARYRARDEAFLQALRDDVERYLRKHAEAFPLYCLVAERGNHRRWASIEDDEEGGA